MDYSNKCLTLIGAASIQDYIFRSNDLKENVGASEIVYSELRHLYNSPPAGCKPVYAGGGNSALVFDSEATAKQAIREWTSGVVKQFPGFRVVVAHQPVVTNLRAAWTRAREKLLDNEGRPPLGSELGALPFVKVCASTGLAASDEENNDTISAESKAKRRKRDSFKARLESDVLQPIRSDSVYAIPEDFGNLGMQTGASQIALVHADGNDIGKEFARCGSDSRSDDEFVSSIRELSQRLTDTERDALQLTVKDISAKEVLQGLDKEGLLERQAGTQKYFLPIRPIVFGGDDVTFVCQGRLGLTLATRYIRHFEEAARKNFQGRTFTCCAGVLVMPQKFPFSRAYGLVESLCSSAKKQRRKSGEEGSWLDFQLLLEGASGSLESLRRTLYGEDYDGLLGRPYSMSAQGSRNSWTSFETAYKHFTSGRTRWPRNRLKQMLEAVAAQDGGDVLLQQTFSARGYLLPPSTNPRDCFDALEMADFRFELKPETGAQTGAA